MNEENVIQWDSRSLKARNIGHAWNIGHPIPTSFLNFCLHHVCLVPCIKVRREKLPLQGQKAKVTNHPMTTWSGENFLKAQSYVLSQQWHNSIITLKSNSDGTTGSKHEYSLPCVINWRCKTHFYQLFSFGREDLEPMSCLD